MIIKTYHDNKVVISTKITSSFKKELQRIALNHKVAPSNVLMSFMIEGYRKYCEENGYETGNYDELKKK